MGDAPRPVSLPAVATALAIVYLVWGSTYLGIHFALEGGYPPLLFAPIAWSFGSVWSRGRDLPTPFMGAAAQMLCGGAAMLVVALLLGERITALPSPKATLSLVYLTVFGSIVAFSAYIWLLHNVRTTLAASYAYVNPVIAVVLGAWLASERFSAHDLGAMAVILAGVVAITLARTRPPMPVVAKDVP